MQYNINKVAAKISVLSSGKIDKYDYLKGKELWQPQQNRIIQEAKSSYSPLGKAIEKQTKTIDEHDKNQGKDLQSLDLINQQIQSYRPQTKSTNDIFPKGLLNQGGIHKLKNFLEIEWRSNTEDLLYKTGDTKKDWVHDFENIRLCNLFE